MGFADTFWHQRHVADFHKKLESAGAKFRLLNDRMEGLLEILSSSPANSRSDEAYAGLVVNAYKTCDVPKMQVDFESFGRELGELRKQAEKLGSYSDIWNRFESLHSYLDEFMGFYAELETQDER